ncbi:MAG: hypothetical protein M3513_12725 [Actinomycetota bacterium]|nr:hypothetical protein [Actinomycetota bacterium]
MTPPPSSLHYTVGPIVALVAILLIIVFLRWTFSQRTQRDPFAPPSDSTGLLQAAASLPDRPKALALRAVLSDAGIRSTIREHPRHGVQVLVFPDDSTRARQLAGPFATPG